MASIEVNRQAPDFKLKDYRGKVFKLSDYRGQKNILLVLNRGFI